MSGIFCLDDTGLYKGGYIFCVEVYIVEGKVYCYLDMVVE